jgi:hypothetical protein
MLLKEYYSDIQEFLSLKLCYSGIQRRLPLKAAVVSKTLTKFTSKDHLQIKQILNTKY